VNRSDGYFNVIIFDVEEQDDDDEDTSTMIQLAIEIINSAGVGTLDEELKTE
jgi:small nuclear ribonucleoprotein (snRNP)-like protein